ncbi:MAG: glycosyltransferase family 1 protein [Clostridiales bacterium]|nr:glycosyltransferase family 1 protein [Clostridiales bacterium]
MYVFNKITVTPQLPERIKELSKIANNLWWSWNSEFLRLFKQIDIDLWERVEKNPVKFLRLVSQDKLNEIIQDNNFLKKYDELVENFNNYMESKNTWFLKNYANNKNDVIAYFSAEYGLDEIMQIYSGGLGILSGDHLKSASDLGVPLVAVGLLYKSGYFHQKINAYGEQETEFRNIDVLNLPMKELKNDKKENVIVDVKLPRGVLHLKVWQINVGRVNLYLLDSDLEENIEEYRDITSTLYGGNQETRIQQEIVLGMAGVKLLHQLKINPTVYHMNEGHSSFLIIELINQIMSEKKVSFNIARNIVSSKTVFTTHTPVPAGNDIFPMALIETYFQGMWDRFGISKEQFLEMGIAPNSKIQTSGFNMGILALKIAGKKNGVSKLHGAVSRELFSEVWPNIIAHESPITHITNGIHTCTWTAPNLKKLYNKYLIPFWQDMLYDDSIWKNVKNIPDKDLWDAHVDRKRKLLALVKDNTAERLKRNGYTYEQISKVVSGLNPNALTIGFARRFATYKRATLIFRDLERITQILNDKSRPVQLIFAGKAHPADKEGQELIKFIHEISMKPQFKGKVFILEDYSIGMSRYLVSGVDVWLNNPRRPMEASGTSGQKASVNGVINFSILDGWWAEGYNATNGWKIGVNADYNNYEVQDNDDSESIYNTLEKKIIPSYYSQNDKGYSNSWLNMMKESIISTGSKFSTSRMLVDYVNNLYMPLCNLTNKYYSNLQYVTEFEEWKKKMSYCFKDIKIKQKDNIDNETIDAGKVINVKCSVELPDVLVQNVEVQVYYGQIEDTGVISNAVVIPMKLKNSDVSKKIYNYEAEVELTTGGNFGYTFRVMPKHKMLLDAENMNLVKWIEK